MTPMTVKHRVEFASETVTLDDLDEARARYDIPKIARVFESEEDYCIWIEWGDEDL